MSCCGSEKEKERKRRREGEGERGREREREGERGRERERVGWERVKVMMVQFGDTVNSLPSLQNPELTLHHYENETQVLWLT